MTRARTALRRLQRALPVAAGLVVRGLPGAAAIGCAVAGAWLLWGLGWALLVAVPFLLLLDSRTPRVR